VALDSAGTDRPGAGKQGQEKKRDPQAIHFTRG
jgi:hypothetical protein